MMHLIQISWWSRNAETKYVVESAPSHTFKIPKTYKNSPSAAAPTASNTGFTPLSTAKLCSICFITFLLSSQLWLLRSECCWTQQISSLSSNQSLIKTFLLVDKRLICLRVKCEGLVEQCWRSCGMQICSNQLRKSCVKMLTFCEIKAAIYQAEEWVAHLNSHHQHSTFQELHSDSLLPGQLSQLRGQEDLERVFLKTLLSSSLIIAVSKSWRNEHQLMIFSMSGDIWLENDQDDTGEVRHVHWP